MRMLTVILGLFLLLTACESGFKQEALHGHWEAIAITEEGTPLAVDPNQIKLHFMASDHYTYQSTLNYREAGTYQIDGTYLFTRDTLNQASTQKAVEVLKLVNDTLQLKMMDGDKERQLTMVRQ